MSWQPGTGILDPCPPLHSAFEQVAALRSNGEHRGEQRVRPVPRPIASAHAPPSKVAATIPPYRPSTVLFGADRRRELALAEGSARKIGADIGRPGHDERPDQQVEAMSRRVRGSTASASAGSKA